MTQLQDTHRISPIAPSASRSRLAQRVTKLHMTTVRLAAQAGVGASLIFGGCDVNTDIAKTFRNAAGDEFETGVNAIVEGNDEAAGDAFAAGIIDGFFTLFESQDPVPGR